MSELAVTITLPVLIPAEDYDAILDDLLSEVEHAAQRCRVSYVQPTAKRGILSEHSDALS